MSKTTALIMKHNYINFLNEFVMNDQTILAVVGAAIVIYILWALKSVRIFD